MCLGNARIVSVVSGLESLILKHFPVGGDFPEEWSGSSFLKLNLDYKLQLVSGIYPTQSIDFSIRCLQLCPAVCFIQIVPFNLFKLG